ncbi:hypothetical protein OROMI_003154 [Orobanche minor]
MSKSLHNSSSYILLLLNLVLIISSNCNLFAMAIRIEDVCQKTRDVAFCTKVLSSNPPTKTADLREVGFMVIALTYYNTTSIRAKIQSLISKSEKNPDLRDRLIMCDDVYGHALDILKRGVDYLKDRDYIGAMIARGAVGDDGVYCEDTFKRPPPAFKSPLTKENNDIERLSDMIMVISTMLCIAVHHDHPLLCE